MQPRLIRTIFWKDLRDAIRDGRVLVAVLVPLGLGVFYNVVFDEEIGRPSAAVAYVAAEATRLPAELRAAAGDRIELEVSAVADAAAVRRLAAGEEIDLGLVVPAGFDAAIARGEAPPLGLVRPETLGFGGSVVTAALEEALRSMAGQRSAATVETTTVPPRAEEVLIFERIGTAPYFVITTAIFLIAMVALYAVPVILAEEAEKKTLDALTLVASYADVVAAKALVGIAYIAVALALLFGLTRSAPADVAGFVAVAAGLSVALIGFGLLLGALFRSATQLNTWSSLFLLPAIGPVYAVGLPLPGWADALLAALPTSRGAELAIDAMTGEPVFGGAWASAATIAAWGVLAYGLLFWRLARREG